MQFIGLKIIFRLLPVILTGQLCVDLGEVSTYTRYPDKEVYY